MAKSTMIAVIGGACAGSEFAAQLAAEGHQVVVFEQNPLPYGKIEDGLPRWHEKLQKREMGLIDQRLDREGVHFIPQAKLGHDIQIDQLRNDWGFPIVVLANGAWRDRELRLEGLDAITDGSFVYQNPFVYWFNHYPDANYSGTHYRVCEGAVILGGGLASIDVAKICQFEMALRVLRKHEIQETVIQLEHHGLAKTAEKHGLKPDIFDFKPATLIYRRQVEDMPLVPLPEDADATRLEKARGTRAKIIANATAKYGFRVLPLRVPRRIIHEQGSVRAIELQDTYIEAGRVIKTDRVSQLDTRLIISSVGSIPQPLPGLPMNGELYDVTDTTTGRLSKNQGVFCAGNAITGKGNIKASLKSAQCLARLTLAGLSDDQQTTQTVMDEQRAEVKEHVRYLLNFARELPQLDEASLERLRQRVKDMQCERGFETYSSWCEQQLGLRIE